KTLVKFIQNGPIDLGGGEIVPLIEGLFDLTKLILGGDRGYISRSDFDRLISFLIEFNKNIFPVYEHFTTDKELTFGDYQRHRNKVRGNLALISQETRNLLNLNRNSLDRLDVGVFLDRFFVDDLETADKIKSLMFVKRIFLGGTYLDLTHLELENALLKLPELGEIAYDLAKVKSFGFKKDAQIMIERVYLRDVKTVRQNLYFDEDSYEAIFTVRDILEVMEKLELDFGIEIGKYPKEIVKLKKAVFGSGGEFFTSIDIIEGLRHVTNILEEGSLFYRVYSMYQEELNSKEPLTNDFSDFPVDDSREEMFLNHFSEIANNYRFFKGSFSAPFFSFEHFRNPLAIFEIGVLEYFAKLVMNEYGAPHQGARGGYHLTLDQTVALLEDIKRLLRDQGIINIGKSQGGEVAAAADNLVLMSTLFQYQSDGCDDYVCMEVPEITEFMVGLFTALSVKDFFTEEMQKVCADEVDEYNRIYPDCFRRNFVNVLETPNPADSDRSLSDYMPLLSSYIVEMTDDLPQGTPPTESEAYMTFITETEAFTRTCKYFDADETEPVPMKANDAFAVFAGMLNVESTLLKFDQDQNNRLDSYNSYGENEVLEAYYSTYEGAIRGMVADTGGPFLTRFSRQIFQYLVKYGKVPETSNFGSVWQFVKFLLGVNKNADADRTTVATILKVLGEQNAGDNYFKCEECMRDPETKCVPVKCHNDPNTGEVICVDDPWD
ncbi:MAG: hypothetical protein WEB87_05355, partial [Bacteriovoracaceae bacterium]